MTTQVKRTTYGFTIIELITVITIIGILAAIGTVSYSGYQKRAAKSDVVSTAQQVKLKLGEYFTDKNNYPENKAAVVTYIGGVGSQLGDAFNLTKNSQSIQYAPFPSGCGGATSPRCTSYTITIPGPYWGGASTENEVIRP